MQTVITIAVIVFLASILVFGFLSVLKDLLERDFVGSPLVSENGTHLHDGLAAGLPKVAILDAIVTNAREDDSVSRIMSGLDETS